MKFVLLYCLPKNDVNLQKKKKTISQVVVQNLAFQYFSQQLPYIVLLNTIENLSIV